MSKLQPGKTLVLHVERETPLGYMLTDGKEEVLLHRNEATKELAEGEEAAVFVYLDQKGRLASTMTLPTIEEGKYEWVKVVETQPGLGVFVDIGLNKDLLVEKNDLPALESLWPAEGDLLYCTIKVTRRGLLYGKPATEDVMQEIAKEAPASLFNKSLTGTVYRVLRVGTFLITDEGYLGFIHETERKEEPRLGERVQARVIHVKEDGTLNLSLIPRKQDSMSEDADEIYAYLQNRGGAMPYWDKSFPEDIRERFNLSKAAFKRALGKLMKENKVYQEEGWTYIKKEETGDK
ncbi:S1 RNA-binding domain-containing protein [Bacillus songklensis]|uniref:S1 RNA-binding domain-containing protein n=1 Tax=Bacillus songklensis TaxID=1069116 RepID=A0ABV8B1A5_9BACI